MHTSFVPFRSMQPVSLLEQASRNVYLPTSSVANLVHQFEPTSLARMDAVALLQRTDTKFVMTRAQLQTALAAIINDYWVLDIGGVRLHPYQTLYFDTASFALYLQNHAGLRNRYKVRSRQYMSTHQSFFEVKRKNNDRTLKQRIATDTFVTDMSTNLDDAIAMLVPPGVWELEPKLWNDFSRVTLVSKTRAERLTLDLDLCFGKDDRHVGLSRLVIAEVKQHGRDRRSAFIQQMRALNVHAMGFSKYCVGVAMLYPNVKHNNFKPKLQLIQKLTGGLGYDN